VRVTCCRLFWSVTQTLGAADQTIDRSW